MFQRVIFFGGNGHCAARLAAVRANAPFPIIDADYPGFANRPRACSRETFLDTVHTNIEPQLGQSLIYGTGIGGLIALCLRARGQLLETPLLLQAPVLWGLEHRLMPKVMRLGIARSLFATLFRARWFQKHFFRKYFVTVPPPEFQREFFTGYASCAAAADFFDWFTPNWLRQLEQAFAQHPERLRSIEFWWGERDRVVSLQELCWTEAALGRSWPVQTFSEWGHYPMIEQPEEWVRNLSDACGLAAAERLPRCFGAEAE
ncbi:MAG TPA: alpha/beta hydrolase [Gemmataceae bacterium]|nr:alpha/beta hydrolase [Gemmataceae bacterium]